MLPWGVGGNLTGNGRRNHSGSDENSILYGVIVTQVYTIVKIHDTEYLRSFSILLYISYVLKKREQNKA